MAVPWTRRPKVLALRRRSQAADLAVGTLDGFRVHQTGRSAALVSHFGFISVFPLFLVFTTVLGFLLEDNPDLQSDIVDSALAQLPIIGSTLASEPAALQGSVVALVLGLLLALWSGMKAFVALHAALDNTNDVHIDDRRSFVQTRVRALGGIGIIGLAQAASAFLTGVVTAAGLPALSNVLIVIAAAALNTVVLAISYRLLTSATTTWSMTWPGALLAGIGFAGLQVVGTSVIARTQANASSVYGDFAAVIALLAWLSLHASIALVGAELNRARQTSTFWPTAALESDDSRRADPAAASPEPSTSATSATSSTSATSATAP